jgi:hypothetical protein
MAFRAHLKVAIAGRHRPDAALATAAVAHEMRCRLNLSHVSLFLPGQGNFNLEPVGLVVEAPLHLDMIIV